MKRWTVYLTILATLAILALPAFAAKGGKGKGNAELTAEPTISLNEASPAFGSTVTFSVSYPRTVKEAFIRVNCYQDGVLVYGEGGREGSSFTLGGGSSQWVSNGGGAASCAAGLYTFEGTAQTWLAWVEFEAAG